MIQLQTVFLMILIRLENRSFMIAINLSWSVFLSLKAEQQKKKQIRSRKKELHLDNMIKKIDLARWMCAYINIHKNTTRKANKQKANKIYTHPKTYPSNIISQNNNKKQFLLKEIEC